MLPYFLELLLRAEVYERRVFLNPARMARRPVEDLAGPRDLLRTV